MTPEEVVAQFLGTTDTPNKPIADYGRMKMREQREAQQRAARMKAVSEYLERQKQNWPYSGEPYGQSRPDAPPAAEQSVGPMTEARRPDPNLISSALAGAPMAAIAGLMGRGAAPAIGRAAPKVAKAVFEGSRARPWLLGGGALGAATELLEDKPTVQGAVAKGALSVADVASPPLSIAAQMLGYAPEAEAGTPFDKLIRGVRKLAPRQGYERTLPQAEGILETIRDRAPMALDMNRPDRLVEAAIKASYPDEPSRFAFTTPRQFKNLAATLTESGDGNKRIETLAEMLRTRQSLPGGAKQGGDYHVSNFPKFRGFSEIPMLQYMDTDGLGFSRIRGHEGRHRMRAAGKVYGEDTPLIIKALGYEAEELDKSLRNPWVLDEGASKVPSFYNSDILPLILEHNIRPLEFASGGPVRTYPKPTDSPATTGTRGRSPADVVAQFLSEQI